MGVNLIGRRSIHFPDHDFGSRIVLSTKGVRTIWRGDFFIDFMNIEHLFILGLSLRDED